MVIAVVLPVHCCTASADGAASASGEDHNAQGTFPAALRPLPTRISSRCMCAPGVHPGLHAADSLVSWNTVSSHSVGCVAKPEHPHAPLAASFVPTASQMLLVAKSHSLQARRPATTTDNHDEYASNSNYGTRCAECTRSFRSLRKPIVR